jgi:hypothetical protein
VSVKSVQFVFPKRLMPDLCGASRQGQQPLGPAPTKCEYGFNGLNGHERRKRKTKVNDARARAYALAPRRV